MTGTFSDDGVNPPDDHSGPVQVERWPTELLLLVVVVLASALAWFFLAVSILGAFYVVMIGIFLFITNLAFIAYLRGSAVRIGPDQMPELHARVEEISHRLGLKKTPETYLMQAGGDLNAFATRFLRANIVVLFADLLDACGDNLAARDMIIGHEMGHLRAGHLRWRWFLLPGMLIPLLGSAYSQAREYTCDRYGAAVCGDRKGALLGLAILSAGGAHGPKVNIERLANQREALNTGWMTLGAWLGTHPPIAHRLSALEPAFAEGRPPLTRGPLRAVLFLFLGVSIPMVTGGWFAVSLLPQIQEALGLEDPGGMTPAGPPVVEDVEGARRTAIQDMEALGRIVESFRLQVGRAPDSVTVLYDAWALANNGQPAPTDPFDGERYGYFVTKGAWWIWSTGPDGVSETSDDIWYGVDGLEE